jgi:hypothetical protein
MKFMAVVVVMAVALRPRHTLSSRALSHGCPVEFGWTECMALILL